MLDAIDLLLPRGVFRETGDLGRVEFVHDLLRELSYADLSAARAKAFIGGLGNCSKTDARRGVRSPGPSWQATS